MVNIMGWSLYLRVSLDGSKNVIYNCHLATMVVSMVPLVAEFLMAGFEKKTKFAILYF